MKMRSAKSQKVPSTWPRILAMDGGGSSTRARWAAVKPNGRILVIGRGDAGGGNAVSLGFATAAANLQSAFERAAAFDLDCRPPAEIAVIGLAGIGDASVRKRWEEWLGRQGYARKLKLMTDVELLFDLGRPSKSQIALISGTGSIAWGRSVAGTQARSGGRGDIGGDPGSGTWIGRQAIELAADADNGLELSNRAGHLKTGPEHLNPTGIGRSTVASRAADWAKNAAYIIEQSMLGDETATSLLRAAGAAGADLVLDVVQKLNLDAEPFELLFGGGIAVHSKIYRTEVLKRLADRNRKPVSSVVKRSPVLGALRIARELLNSGGVQLT